ncbi:MAG TPA: hypothetical protein VGF45_06445 [Polyangia bacterium]
MKRTLIIGVLALGLFAGGCDDDGDGGNPDARGDGGDAGDARGDGLRADGGDGGTPDILPLDGARDGGDAAEAAQPVVDAPVDLIGGGGGSFDSAPPADSAFAVCRMNMTGVTPADFCTYVMITCGFGSGPGKFTDTATCMLKYNAYTAEQKACAAYHACVAGPSYTNALLHCPHPVGRPNDNPCNLPL